MRKKDLMTFLVWTRNGIAFCVVWFLVLLLIYNSIFNVQTVLTDTLVKMLFWVIGGVLIFNIFFTRLIFRKWSFLTRITCFMPTIGLYEGICFYRHGLFEGSDVSWLIFMGIVFALYSICIAIYQKRCQKQCEIYTLALKRYQRERSAENGK